jgi:hypothetical protein
MIAVDHLTKRYGTVAAVDGLGFEVRQPNGLAIARRAVMLAGRCGTGDDRYSRRVGSRGAGLGLFIGSALNLVFGVPSASTVGASG